MKSHEFKGVYIAMLGIIGLVGLSIFLNTKSENAKKLSLTQKLNKISTNIGKNNSENQNNTTDSETIHEVKMNENMLTKERVYTEEEITKLANNQFLDLLKDIERRMPKKSDLKKIPAEALHQTPPIIIIAGRDLGLIKEIIKIHPEYETDAINFYNQCAENNDTPTTVRAICLTNLIIINKKNGKDFSTAKYPKEIVDLSKIVTDL